MRRFNLRGSAIKRFHAINPGRTLRLMRVRTRRRAVNLRALSRKEIGDVGRLSRSLPATTVATAAAGTAVVGEAVSQVGIDRGASDVLVSRLIITPGTVRMR